MEQSYPLHLAYNVIYLIIAQDIRKHTLRSPPLCHIKHLNLHCLLFFSLGVEQNYLKTALLLIIEVIMPVVQRKSGDLIIKLIIIWALIDSLISWQLMSLCVQEK